MTFKEAIAVLSRDEGFKATVYAMNTLLIKKGVYTHQEFESLFCEHARNYLNGFRGKTEITERASGEAVHAIR